MEPEPERTSIGVYARIRPGAGPEKNPLSIRRRHEQQKALRVRALEFCLDWIFDADATQEEVYERVGRERVERVLTGCNACLMAYGQTGSGKTHTMFGPDEVLTNWSSSTEQHGLALRAISDLFEGLSHSTSSSSFLVSCSYLEVYNDSVNDLLGGRKNLQLRDSPSHGTVVDGLAAEVVASAEETMGALQGRTCCTATPCTFPSVHC